MVGSLGRVEATLDRWAYDLPLLRVHQLFSLVADQVAECEEVEALIELPARQKRGAGAALFEETIPLLLDERLRTDKEDARGRLCPSA
jgi:hypothetical protein